MCEPVLERIHPASQRDAILDLFHRNGKTEFTRTFDWHYAQEACRSRAWCLTSKEDRIVGFIAVFDRIAHVDTSSYRVGVPGDLMIDEAYRSIGAAVTLVRATQCLVTSGELDLLVVQGNRLSDRLMQRLGYRGIGRWQTHALLLRSKSKANKRFGTLGTLVSPAIDIWTKYRLNQTPTPKGYTVMVMGESDLNALDVGEWHHHDLVSIYYEPNELAWRFLRDPREATCLYGIFDLDGVCVAYAATAIMLDKTYNIKLLQTDSRRLTHAQTLQILAKEMDCHAISLNLPEKSSFKHEIKPPGFISEAPKGLPLVAYWQDNHPLHSVFIAPESWQLFRGFMDI